MNLTIRLLGCEVFHVSTDPDGDERGDATTYPVGFVAPATESLIREPGRDLT